MKPQKLSIARRPKLPFGISYHDTPAGVKYRIRIRSVKKLKELGADKEIDEIYNTLKKAEERLIKLKYKTDEVYAELIKKTIAETRLITFDDLFQIHFKEYYLKLKSAKEHKSRMNVILKTIVNDIDVREYKLLSLKTNYLATGIAKEIEFGFLPIEKYDIFINQFIEARRKTVKNQTIVNDLMFIHTALKNSHKYFKNLTQIERPLKSVDFKTLEEQVTYKDKRITAETRIFIEQLLIQKSRKSHYQEMFIFLAETGVRISEALSITKKDCDLKKGIIFLISKKNDKPRYLGITQKLREVIENRTKNINLTDRIFDYSKETYQTKLRNIRPILKEKGIVFTWHMLRHTFISNSMNSNKSIAQLMSETDINNYQHFQQKYLNNFEAEQIAIKVSKAQQLTAHETMTVAGHSNLQVSFETYTHQKEITNEERLLKENNEIKQMLVNLMKKLEEKNKDDIK